VRTIVVQPVPGGESVVH